VLKRAKREHLPHFESITVRILKDKGEASAAEIAEEMFPGQTNGELRPKISQVSVSLKRLEKKGLVTGEKRGRKNFFRLIK